MSNANTRTAYGPITKPIAERTRLLINLGNIPSRESGMQKIAARISQGGVARFAQPETGGLAQGRRPLAEGPAGEKTGPKDNTKV